MSIVLIGYRGCGKTTVGRKLAERLHQPFIDTDDLIVAAAGKTIKDIFQQQGEPAFRDLETQAIRHIAQLPNHVIALGGGALNRPDNRQFLQSSGHKILYLRCDPLVLLNRIQSDPNSSVNRPNLTSLGGGIEEVQRLLTQREPFYRQVMHAELDVTHLTPDQTVLYIVQMPGLLPATQS